MKSLGFVLITRRFWPLLGGAETATANLAVQLLALGGRPRILTVQWSNDWPPQIIHRGVPVIRLPNPPVSGWGSFRYTSDLSRWLNGNRDRIDLVYVSSLKDAAYAAIGALARRGTPIVLRVEGTGPSGDCQWQNQTHFGRRVKYRCRLAGALIAPTAPAEEELKSAGYAPDKIVRIADGVPIGPPRDAASKAAARAALAEANPDLALPDHTRLVLYTGRLHKRGGLDHLVAAWSSIVARWPNARLWLVGDGPFRKPLLDRIGNLGLSGRALLPGSFDCVDELLNAADVFVLPSREGGQSLSLLEAMAAGLPIVAGDTPANRGMLADDRQGLIVGPGSAESLAGAILRLFDEPSLARRLGTEARRRACEDFSLAAAASAHQELFERLVRVKSRAGGPRSG